MAHFVIDFQRKKFQESWRALVALKMRLAVAECSGAFIALRGELLPYFEHQIHPGQRRVLTALEMNLG